MKTGAKKFTVQELCELLNGKLIGETDYQISEPEQIESANTNSITFIGNKKYMALWGKSKAAAVIGDHTQIKLGSVVAERCIIGHYCILQSNVSIGSDGFGYRPNPDGRGIIKISHIGNVVIGNHVEIGSSTCIDKGKFSSTTIGDCVIMAGQAAIKDHITVGKGVTIGGRSGIMNDIPDGKTILGYPAIEAKETLRQWAALRRLGKKGTR